MSEEARDISKLQEVFGMTVTEAQNAYVFYKKDINDAITGLTKTTFGDNLSLEQAIERSPLREAGDGSYGTNTQTVATCSPNPTSVGTTNTNPIDLTQESQDDDLQKALALSLQDMQQSTTASNTGISIEDQELSKALEASIADNQTTLERYGLSSSTSSNILIDPLNPHNRIRTVGTPVGLKNIGNTCWFSAVIQSLFNISIFRELVINFTTSSLDDCESDLPLCVQFVLELQKLFALLLKSSQKYINPKPAIDLLSAVFKTLGNQQQQDVSEFTHKLLEWIEDAFAFQIKDTTNTVVTCTEEKSPVFTEDNKTHDNKKVDNPMIELFTGECVTEGILNEQPFTNYSKFGAFPVQIEGFTDLHDSLEAAMNNTDMKQETWFTHLPPVLVLELSRFKYNQTTGQAEKIHDELSFDKTLYMDRYLQCKANESRQLRNEMSKLRHKIKHIKSVLKSYTDYRGNSIGINVVLSLASQYTDVEQRESGDNNDCPAPRTGNEQEIKLVSNWLKQWQYEMSSEISELESNLSATEITMNSIYNISSMNNTGYTLHAVLVHEGQASRGHYWAYVRKYNIEQRQEVDNNTLEISQEKEETVQKEQQDKEMEIDTTNNIHTSCSPLSSCDTQTPPSVMDTTDHTQSTDHTPLEENKEVWLKYNDISVIEVDWNEVKRESFGGTTSTASAYCLLYISDTHNNTTTSTDNKAVLVTSSSDQLLPSSLEQYVVQHNISFDNEIKLHDLKHQHNTLQEQRGGGGEKDFIKPAKIVRFANDSRDSGRGSLDMMTSALASDAKRARPDDSGGSGCGLHEGMQIDMDNLPPVDPSLMLQFESRLEQKLHYLTQSLPDTIIESRILTEYHYVNDGQCSETVRQAILYEMLIIDFDNESNINMSLLARKELNILCKDSQVFDELKQVKHLYHLFCCVCYHFIQSINEYSRSNSCISLAHIIQCFDINTQICELSNEKYALDCNLLGKYRSQALLQVSELGTSAFISSGDISTSIVIGNEYIVPSLKAFNRLPFTGDELVLEKVRQDWCQCLDQNSLTEDDSDKLADLLVKIVEDYSKSPNIKVPQSPLNFDTQRLAAQFSNAYTLLTQQILMS